MGNDNNNNQGWKNSWIFRKIRIIQNYSNLSEFYEFYEFYELFKFMNFYYHEKAFNACFTAPSNPETV